MKKKISVMVATAICAATFVTGAMAGDIVRNIKAQLRPDFTVKIDGEVTEFKNAQGEVVYPVLYDGTTYLPVRAIGELMGKTVYWNEDDKLIELKDGKNTTVTDADVIVDSGDKNNQKDNSYDAEPIVKESNGKGNAYGKREEHHDKDHCHDKCKYEEDCILYDKNDFIGADKAKEIALKKAGYAAEDVIFEKAKLDKDDGIWLYEVEFRYDKTEYEAEIAADDGRIISWEADKEYLK